MATLCRFFCHTGRIRNKQLLSWFSHEHGIYSGKSLWNKCFPKRRWNVTQHKKEKDKVLELTWWWVRERKWENKNINKYIYCDEKPNNVKIWNIWCNLDPENIGKRDALLFGQVCGVFSYLFRLRMTPFEPYPAKSCSWWNESCRPDISLQIQTAKFP